MPFIELWQICAAAAVVVVGFDAIAQHILLNVIKMLIVMYCTNTHINWRIGAKATIRATLTSAVVTAAFVIVSENQSLDAFTANLFKTTFVCCC